VRVVASDSLLIDALREQRAYAVGWQVEPSEPTRGASFERNALVIVDLAESDAQRSAVEAIRQGGFSGPILLIGEGPATEETIARPVRLGSLLARINAHWAAAPSGGATALGPYQLLPADYALRDMESGRLVRLTELELRLLTYLIDSNGELVDREQLLRQVWGYSADADTHTVETHIWRLRQKIETDDPATRFVVTETGGYRLVLAGGRSAA